jgi:uncharacterized membrane protein YebE (DUF533 family)
MEQQPTEKQLLAFARALANIAAADGHIEPEERDELDRVIAGTGLSPGDEKVQRLVETEFAHPSPLPEIVKAIDNKEMRGLLVRMMAELACADGECSSQERAKVTEAAGLFGYEPALANDLIAWVLDSIALEHREHQLMARLMK